MKTTSTRYFLVLGALVLILGSGPSRAQPDFDRESYHRAVEYCRGTISWSTRLSPDARVLCFDGIIMKDADISLARETSEGGLFVVRSAGGNVAAALALSNVIRERRLTVVVYDYCLSTCAGFFLIAPHQAFVVKGALVAWNYAGSGEASSPCVSLQTPPDRGPKKWRPVRCNESTEINADRVAQNRFYRERVVSPLLEAPPDSLYVRKAIRNRFGEMNAFDDTAWTIHPRFYPTLFKTKIIFESYPESQQEVDDMVSQLRLGIRIIYDP